MNRAAKGHHKERKTKALLEAQGWLVIRAPASLGPCDLIALKAGERPRVFEVKCNSGSPYMNFRAADRKRLVEVAAKAGAGAELVFWGPRVREPKFIPAEAWPA